MEKEGKLQTITVGGCIHFKNIVDASNYVRIKQKNGYKTKLYRKDYLSENKTLYLVGFYKSCGHPP